MAIVFEQLVGRDVARFISSELDLAAVKMSPNAFIGVAIIGFFIITVLMAFGLVIFLQLNSGIALLAGIIFGVLYEVILYSVLELRIDGRKSFVEDILPDYLQLASANMRSGVPLAKALIMAVRPEFKYFGDDVNAVGKQLYSGETMQNVLEQLANKYRSLTLRRTVRVVVEAQMYGGGMADLLNQIAKDLRNQHIVQKEVSGQLFMYTIFIAFAALIGAPSLYALTNQMIGVTSSVWSKISINSISNLPNVGVSFIKLSKPQITPQDYFDFSVVAIIIIAGFGAFIISAISTGVPIRGIKFLPVYIVIGLVLFTVVGALLGSLFSSFQSQ
ncbi:MAG: type II secretion system F family protein [Candidatus Micrarchaeota archaeon]|nr:type II secretion system F family protein [Candidatus Micrarchaeota archaeon]MDE1834767.1 type II secretion system F family protein [Candidatus Micrarchaeota archaeon]MDE1859380.1 type II secretion system F family protein [Candidatus Micrarchaeota archaeon]